MSLALLRVPSVKFNTNTSDVTDLQRDIMLFVDKWVHEQKTIVPRTEIYKELNSSGILNRTIEEALNSLLRKGYIRKAVTISNKTYYVQQKRV